MPVNQTVSLKNHSFVYNGNECSFSQQKKIVFKEVLPKTGMIYSQEIPQLVSWILNGQCVVSPYGGGGASPLGNDTLVGWVTVWNWPCIIIVTYIQWSDQWTICFKGSSEFL